MNIKEVITTTGEKVIIDLDTRKIYDYSNADRKVVWTAKIADSDCWTAYEEERTLDDIEDRLKTWNNPVRFLYARQVDFKASDNDPDRAIWNRLVDWCRHNETMLFDSNGDWRKIVGIDPKTMQIKVGHRGGARPGAGRKPTGKTPKQTWSVKVTPKEKEQLMEVLKCMRQEELEDEDRVVY